MINDEKLSSLLNKLDGSGSERELGAVAELREMDIDLPALLLEKYRISKRWQIRSSCVYHSIRYARSSRAAVELGIEALLDESKIVRYRACMLLAYSLCIDGLSYLKQIKERTSCLETIANTEAAIDSIENNNSNYFVDREHSGKILLRVN